MLKNETRRQRNDYIELSVKNEDDEPPDLEEQDDKSQQKKALLSKEERETGEENIGSSGVYFEETDKKEPESHERTLAIQVTLKYMYMRYKHKKLMWFNRHFHH